MRLIQKCVPNTLYPTAYVKILLNTKSEFTKYDYRNGPVEQYGSQNPDFSGRAVASLASAAPTIDLPQQKWANQRLAGVGADRLCASYLFLH
jgi:hypothetical protein